VRTGTAIHPDSELIPVARAGGITAVLSLPTGGVVSGRSSLIRLSGWTPPEMNVEEVVGLHVNWPRRLSEEATKEQKERRKERLAQLDELFQLAKHYDRARSAQAQAPSPEDPRLEALLPFVRGERPVMIEAERHGEILDALKFAEKQGLKLVLVGATDAWKVADDLKKRDVAVMVGPVMTGPIESYDPYDAAYANAGRLHAAGVRFCIRSNSAANSRNLPFEAAQAVAYGLPPEEGLKAVTLYPAQILGVADRLGSIEPGKLANLILTTGNPLQPATEIKGIVIAGRLHEPTSKQTRLYERYRQRLAEVKAGSSPLGLNRGESQTETAAKSGD
jgi:imidazolonepropionase-like amidohydrolase